VAELVRAGELPARPDLLAEVFIGAPETVCLVCEAAGAQVAYRCWDGRRFALHASCGPCGPSARAGHERRATLDVVIGAIAFKEVSLPVSPEEL
jgi:hypothetical protein